MRDKTVLSKVALREVAHLTEAQREEFVGSVTRAVKGFDEFDALINQSDDELKAQGFTKKAVSVMRRQEVMIYHLLENVIRAEEWQRALTVLGLSTAVF